MVIAMSFVLVVQMPSNYEIHVIEVGYSFVAAIVAMLVRVATFAGMSGRTAGLVG